jgi:RimJ/RimL family protein N-acetyltransferase
VTVPSLPWVGYDKAGEPLMLRLAELRDATSWVDHLRRITTETPWMLQSEEDPVPTPTELRQILEEYESREGSVAICAVRPGGPRGDREVGRQEILGTITLANGRSRRNEHVAELSMGVGQQWWGLGIGTLLMEAALTAAERGRIVKRVSLSVFSENKVAQALYERFGFLHEGVLKRYVRWEGRYEDLVVMARWVGPL